jgi:hypothetical protein
LTVLPSLLIAPLLCLILLLLQLHHPQLDQQRVPPPLTMFHMIVMLAVWRYCAGVVSCMFLFSIAASLLLTWVPSSLCCFCCSCIIRFDHHCGWINNCVGLANTRHFLAFLLANFLLCCYGTALSVVALHGELQQRGFFDV